MAETSDDRRSTRRYRMELPVRYRILSRQQPPTSGVGVTTNLSSGGVAFVSDTELQTGESVEVWVDWPFVAEGVRRVELRTAGRVVRSSGAEIAIRARRQDFISSRKDIDAGEESAGLASHTGQA